MLVTVSQEQRQDSLARRVTGFSNINGHYPRAIPSVLTDKSPGLFGYWIALCFTEGWAHLQAQGVNVGKTRRFHFYCWLLV